MRRDAETREVLRSAYERIGVTRDDLPYTAAFDSMCRQVSRHALEKLGKHEIWELLGWALKRGGAPRMKRGSPAPQLGKLDRQVLESVLPGPVSHRDRWPYTKEFEQACKQFNSFGGHSFSRHEIWRAVCNIGKAAGGSKALDRESKVRARLLPTTEYAEGKRLMREKKFFARNPELARLAKERYGYSCQACGFDFARMYGPLGEGYIECHHLNPLSERSESQWSTEVRTRIEDVTVLCANCHRMIHRCTPALSLERLKGIIKGNSRRRRA
jgi:hypothetical protein